MPGGQYLVKSTTSCNVPDMWIGHGVRNSNKIQTETSSSVSQLVCFTGGERHTVISNTSDENNSTTPANDETSSFVEYFIRTYIDR